MPFTTNVSLQLTGSDPTVDASNSAPLSLNLAFSSVLATGAGAQVSTTLLPLTGGGSLPTPVPIAQAQYLLVQLSPSNNLLGPTGFAILSVQINGQAVVVSIPDGGAALIPLIGVSGTPSLVNGGTPIAGPVGVRVSYF